MSVKITEIVEHINTAVNSKDNESSTAFLQNTHVYVKYKDGSKLFLVRREDKIMLPIFVEKPTDGDSEVTYKHCPLIALLFLLSGRPEIKGLAFIEDSKYVTGIVVNNR